MVLVPIHTEERDHGAGVTAECFKSMDCGIAKTAPIGPRVRWGGGGGGGERVVTKVGAVAPLAAGSFRC